MAKMDYSKTEFHKTDSHKADSHKTKLPKPDGSLSENRLSESLYQLLLRCGSQHNPYDFCGQIVKEITKFVPYNQARVLFLDISGRISGSMLYGVRQNTWQNFLSYYKEGLAGSAYSLGEPLKLSAAEKVAVCDWAGDEARKKKHPAFFQDYVTPLKLTYCLGVGLSDENNCIRSIITLDRTTRIPYSEREILLIRKLHPLLEHLFINLLLPAPGEFSSISFLQKQFDLTPREREIVDLTCSGMSPKEIGMRLSLSISTVYRHMANIYDKCGISSRQELYRLFASRS